MVLPQAQRHTGFLGLQSTMNILVITQKQSFILETPNDLQDQIDEMEDQLQNRGSEGLLDDHEFIKAYDFSKAPWQIYARLPLQEEHLTLETASIQKVEVAMHDGWRDDTLRIYLPGETIKFDLLWPLGEIALKALRTALGDRVKDVS